MLGTCVAAALLALLLAVPSLSFADDGADPEEESELGYPDKEDAEAVCDEYGLSKDHCDDLWTDFKSSDICTEGLVVTQRECLEWFETRVSGAVTGCNPTDDEDDPDCVICPEEGNTDQEEEDPECASGDFTGEADRLRREAWWALESFALLGVLGGVALVAVGQQAGVRLAMMSASIGLVVMVGNGVIDVLTG